MALEELIRTTTLVLCALAAAIRSFSFWDSARGLSMVSLSRELFMVG